MPQSRYKTASMLPAEAVKRNATIVFSADGFRQRQLATCLWDMAADACKSGLISSRAINQATVRVTCAPERMLRSRCGCRGNKVGRWGWFAWPGWILPDGRLAVPATDLQRIDFYDSTVAEADQRRMVLFDFHGRASSHVRSASQIVCNPTWLRGLEDLMKCDLALGIRMKTAEFACGPRGSLIVGGLGFHSDFLNRNSCFDGTANRVFEERGGFQIQADAAFLANQAHRSDGPRFPKVADGVTPTPATQSERIGMQS